LLVQDLSEFSSEGGMMIKKRISHALFMVAALVLLLSAVGVSSAMATPKGEYKVFEQCPLKVEEVQGCLVSRTESGEITIGKQSVPIVNTQTLQGGFIENRETGALKFVGAANGETLSKTPQKVPGGLLGIDCGEMKGEGWFEKVARGTCEFLFENKETNVYATTELAAPASSIGLNELFLEIEEGTALSLPVKVKLENPLLGSECYIGSEAHPITLELTTGSSGSLKGKLGEISDRAGGGVLVIKDNTLVDSDFKAPEATGCGGIFSFLIDPILDAKLGLPATTGDAAVLNGTIEQASAELVKESEA
jgi:hypothetical protein